MMLPTLDADTESAHDITLLATLFAGEDVLLLVRSDSGLRTADDARMLLAVERAVNGRSSASTCIPLVQLFVGLLASGLPQVPRALGPL
mmetsp:Transcript_2447/g.5035  ORF Transcript_2447/g.5035 Transcript_2447/m.5035 type:complete len:89 (+) Transcript_2447:450-716(+)